MAPALVHATSANGSSAASFGITIPATTAGNLLVAYLVTYTAAANPTLNVPTGWTGLAQTNQDVFINISTRAYYLPNCAGGTTSLTFTASATANGWGLIVMEYSGVATSSPLDTSTTNAPGTGGYGFTATLSPANSGDLMVGLYYVDLVAGNTPSPVTPASWTRAKLTTDGPGDVDIVADYATGQNTYAPSWNSTGTKVDYAYHVLAFTAASSGSTPITLSDSGTGSDSLSVQATIPLSESGTGADSLSVQANVPLSDSGTGADSLSVQASVPLADAGTGADSLSTAVTVTYTDSGTGADTLSSLNVTLGLTENGAGTDNLSSVLVSLALTDSGTGADSITLGNPIAFSDAGAGAETFSLAPVTITLTDSGTGNDGAFSLAPVTFTLSESGSGADVLLVGGATVPGLCTVSDAAVAVVTLSDSAVGVVAVSDSPAEGS